MSNQESVACLFLPHLSWPCHMRTRELLHNRCVCSKPGSSQVCDMKLRHFLWLHVDMGLYLTWPENPVGNGAFRSICIRMTTVACAHHVNHYNDVIMSLIASQITSLTIVYSAVYSDADQREHQSPASLAFVGEFTGDRWFPRTNGQ